MRIVTTLADGSQSEKIIDPREVDVSNASEYEMLAFNSYLVEQGKLDNDVYKTGLLQDSCVTDTKRNYIEIAKQLMEMQYNAKNMSGFVKYNKIWSMYNEQKK